jgi:hypothetical protein
MIAPGQHTDLLSITLGHRRGISDLARFALDLAWDKAGSCWSAARLGDYPSPPMSGSPPPPPPTTRESAERAYPPPSQDVYRGIHSTQTGMEGPGRHYGADAASSERMPPYALPPRSAEPPTLPPLSYGQQGQPMRSQPPYQQHSAPPGPGPAPAPYSGTTAASGASTGSPRSTTQQDISPRSSPKLQRKTKGHVASACVPCKRAHLRCVAP